MTAHELAKTLLDGPDLPVVFTGEMGGLEEVDYVTPWEPAYGTWLDSEWKRRTDPALELVSR